MSGVSGARSFTEADKAKALVTLVANGGLIKRTSQQLGIAPATLRRWRDAHDRAKTTGQALVPPQTLSNAVGDFIDHAASVRDKALLLLEERIDDGDIKTSELITAVGVLDDKVTRVKDIPGLTVKHQLELPSREEAQALLEPFLAAGLANAARRHVEIIDAEVVSELPPGD